MARREAPLDVEIDERKDLRIVQLFGKRRRIGVFADPFLQPGIGQERRHSPLLPATRIEHVPFGHGLGEATERALQRLHVVRVVADHQAKRSRVDPVRRLGKQIVIGIEQEDVRQFALKQRQLARHVDRGHVLLDRAATERSSHAFTRDLVEFAHDHMI